ncbi:MAG: zinc-dependent alcohol dehydrogenase [Planctomycetota bacterium]|jgi:L-iditol 2-dehydrogenase
MRRVVLQAPGDLRIEEAPVPEPAPGEVVLKIGAALTCGTDLKTWRRGHPKLPVPGPFGHEYAGKVHAVGDRVTEFAVGDRAAGTPTGPCGVCDECTRGKPNLCGTLFDEPALGAFGEYLRIPARIVRTNLVKIPAGVRDDEAACIDPLASVVHGQEVIGDLSGCSVVVVGAGATGLLQVQVALANGAERVVVVGRGAARLQIAMEFGASVAIDVDADGVSNAVRAACGGHGPDVVIEAVGNATAWRFAADVVRNGGRVLLFGGCAGGTEVAFDAEKLHYGEVALFGAFHYTPEDVRTALELLQRHVVRPGPLFSVRTGLDGLENALFQMADKKVLKAVVIP